jgi:starch synthase
MSTFGLTGLPDDLLGIDGLEYYGQISMMKGGILFSDMLTTVSPSYAREILEPEHGAGLDGVLATRIGDISGLVNGIDQEVWNPETDPELPAQFSASDLSGKATCRAKLLSEFGLDPTRTAPVFGLVGRLTEQKGIQLRLRNAGFFAKHDARIAIVGVGEERFRDALAAVSRELKGRFAFLGAIDERRVHLLVAGSDFLLMPSIFEPCGLTQMYAQRYGTIPLTSAVGGLLDTVVDLNRDPANATGVRFPPTEAGVADALEVALALHADETTKRAMMLRGMRKDFSWETAARAYEQVTPWGAMRPPIA